MKTETKEETPTPVTTAVCLRVLRLSSTGVTVVAGVGASSIVMQANQLPLLPKTSTSGTPPPPLKRRAKRVFSDSRDPRWRNFSFVVRGERGPHCESCGHPDDWEAGRGLETHHHYYIDGNETWEVPKTAVESICKACHSEKESALRKIQGSLPHWLSQQSKAAELTELNGLLWNLLPPHKSGAHIRDLIHIIRKAHGVDDASLEACAKWHDSSLAGGDSEEMAFPA